MDPGGEADGSVTPWRISNLGDIGVGWTPEHPQAVRQCLQDAQAAM